MRWIAQDIGATVHTELSSDLGMGGETISTSPADVELRFGPSDVPESEWHQWSTEVGVVDHWKAQWPVVLGQRGCFDEFTVTMSRHSQALAFTQRDDFDQRFHL
jgi:hypothetical protein